ncbi:hypothetical protein BB559_004888 [Furculomyces boomerangus]|uniref:Importin N-terminal domain-containing protein n=2 Tax=Harpellales TaxID=61421 RepID=A0A2T9YC15_9FUNG|nr:hypothetical protein BB559_004888 [Furculomyces boomerangus]PVZ98601.1 hypothetical protein BB558_005394 [Smittium angustum]
MDWQPQQQDLAQLIHLLFNTQNPNNAIQQENHTRLIELQKVPNFVNYLVYVLTKMPEQSAEIRAVAGLLLKNKISQDFSSLRPEDLIYLKTQALASMGDSDSLVRHTLGTVIATLVIMDGISKWPEALSQLFIALDSPKFEIAEGAWDTLSKICEDSRTNLDDPLSNGQRPLEIMIPKFLQFFSSEYPIFRVHAIRALTTFVQLQSETVHPFLNVYITELFKRANDDDLEVRKSVCRAIVALLDTHIDKLIPEIDNVVAYMLFSTQSEDLGLATEACEFWLSFCESEAYVGHLKPHLKDILPVLLSRTPYSEEDLIVLDIDENDAVVPDTAQDIKPRHHKARVQGIATDSGTEWNLRKCAAASLDVMSTIFRNEILPFILPSLNEALFSENWVKRESGILVLGAIAEGCASGIEEHLPNLMPYLITGCTDKHYLVRSISCWTSSRFSAWATRPENNQFFANLLETLLKVMLDNNKRVQESACSAFATLEEAAGQGIMPYIEHVLQTLVFAFDKYQNKNLIILYDSIGTLAESVGPGLANPKYIEILMPNLMGRLSAIMANFGVTDDEFDTFPLLECLSSVAISLGPSFLPFASPVFYNCVNVIQTTLKQYQQASEDEDLNLPDKDLINVSLDLISALIQAIESRAVDLIKEDPSMPLLQLVGICMSDSSAEVRQSAFALLGDLAMNCWDLISGLIPFFMQQIAPQVDPQFTFVNVANNAIWASGEIAIRAKNGIAQYVPTLMERMIPIINSADAPLPLIENSAIAIGRLGYASPDTIAPILESFIDRWCQVIVKVEDENERVSSMHGMLNVVSMFGPEARAEFERRLSL